MRQGGLRGGEGGGGATSEVNRSRFLIANSRRFLIANPVSCRFAHRSVGFREGWEFLDTLNHAVGGVKGEGGWSLERSDGGGDFVEVYNQHFGHWDWRRWGSELHIVR